MEPDVGGNGSQRINARIPDGTKRATAVTRLELNLVN
jgi:hypothetical protein